MRLCASLQGWAATLTQLIRLATAVEQQAPQPEQQPGQQPQDADRLRAQSACTAVRRLKGLFGVAAALAAETARTDGLAGSSESEASNRRRARDVGPALAQLLELYWAARCCFRTEEWWEGVVWLSVLTATMQSMTGHQRQQSVLEV